MNVWMNVDRGMDIDICNGVTLRGNFKVALYIDRGQKIDFF